MACCLTAPSHYLNQCWLITRGVLWHTSESSFAGIAQGIDSGYEFEKDILKNIFKSPRGQWVKVIYSCNWMNSLKHSVDRMWQPLKGGISVSSISPRLWNRNCRNVWLLVNSSLTKTLAFFLNEFKTARVRYIWYMISYFIFLRLCKYAFANVHNRETQVFLRIQFLAMHKILI